MDIVNALENGGIMAVLYLLVGILIGWLIEWAIDWFYWRGRFLNVQAQLENCRTSLMEEQERSRQYQAKASELNQELTNLHAEIRELEAKLNKVTSERDSALQELKTLTAKSATPPVKEPVDETQQPDDLKKIEGIGPKIEKLLHQAGIRSFATLARTPVEKLREILQAAGSRYRLADPTTWPRQAEMAASGRWEELKDYQDALNGGREG